MYGTKWPFIVLMYVRRHFFLDSGATAQCELVLTAPSRNILTYFTLLTYVKKLLTGPIKNN